jgi:hypothetical protein
LPAGFYNTNEIMKENITITECSKCGARYENYFNASPCCKSIIFKVDEHGNRTTITFLSALSLPPASVRKFVEAAKDNAKIL